MADGGWIAKDYECEFRISDPCQCPVTVGPGSCCCSLLCIMRGPLSVGSQADSAAMNHIYNSNSNSNSNSNYLFYFIYLSSSSPFPSSIRGSHNLRIWERKKERKKSQPQRLFPPIPSAKVPSLQSGLSLSLSLSILKSSRITFSRSVFKPYFFCFWSIQNSDSFQAIFCTTW
jgi:hypothetical protein